MKSHERLGRYSRNAPVKRAAAIKKSLRPHPNDRGVSAGVRTSDIPAVRARLAVAFGLRRGLPITFSAHALPPRRKYSINSCPCSIFKSLAAALRSEYVADRRLRTRVPAIAKG